MTLLAYQYDFVPNDAVLDVVYSLVSPPYFVTLSTTAGNRINIQTTNPADTGVYMIQVKTSDN